MHSWYICTKLQTAECTMYNQQCTLVQCAKVHKCTYPWKVAHILEQESWPFFHSFFILPQHQHCVRLFQCKMKLVMNSESKGLFVCGLIVTFYTFALKVNETLFANYFNDFNLPEKFPLNWMMSAALGFGSGPEAGEDCNAKNCRKCTKKWKVHTMHTVGSAQKYKEVQNAKKSLQLKVHERCKGSKKWSGH